MPSTPNELHVQPGELHLCAAAALRAASSANATLTRCVLAPGTYYESLEYAGSAPLEIIGAGPGQTVLRGDSPLTGLLWTLSTLHNGSVYAAPLPPGELRKLGVQQAFLNDEWLPEARYPNTDLSKVLKLTSWGDCGKGSKHGYCKDRPDAWSRLASQHVNWTGALATLSLGGRYATWTRRVTKYTPGAFHYEPGGLGPGPGSAGAAKPGGRFFLSGVLGALDAPGEWFIDETDWIVYVWAPDSQPPGDRVSIRMRDFCVDTAHAPVVLTNLSMHGCTFRLRNCTGCHISDLNLTYPSYHREVHLRDAKPFSRGPPPNITLLEGGHNTVTRVALRYSNTAGLKVVGSHNRLSELLILDTDWFGTLDYPPLEVGFGNECDSPDIRKANASGCRSVPGFSGYAAEAEADDATPGPFEMYPRNPSGTNNTVTRTTVGRSGSALIVTSQLSNEVSYCHVFGAGSIGKDDAGIHADNSRASCGKAEGRCVKTWHHNWVHDCKAKCVRGDDFTTNLSMHHNVIFNCGVPTSDGAGQSFGVVLKGDWNRFYANTVLRTAQADVVVATGSEGPNHQTVLVNNIASRWSGKKGPTPPSPQQKNRGNWGGNVETVSEAMFVDFGQFDFRPRNNSAAIGKGVLHPPEVEGPSGVQLDSGAYQSSETPWTAGCTFSPQCWEGMPPPPPPSPPAEPCVRPAGSSWACRRRSYCGPKQSFYFEADLNLSECSAACVANSSGCGCFDHAAAADAAGSDRSTTQTTYTCRLHASSADIVTNERSLFTAYWQANPPTA